MLVYRTCSRNNRRLISKMKKLFTLLITAACFTASAQIEVEYPYNPDNQNDGHVGIEDILEILTVYGEEFTPEQLLVEGTSLTEWIQLLSETVIQQQAQIDSLSSLGPTSVEIDSSWINDSVLSNTLLRTRDWPLGFHGEVINHSFNDGSFVVPAGKALFITYTTGWVNLERGESYVTYVNPSYPAAADPYSQVIPIGPSTTVLGSSPSWWFSGVLIDTTGDFEVIYWEFSDGNYHVPEGKIFVPKWSNGEGGIRIQSLDNMWAPQIPEPHFHSVAIASQDVLSNEDTSGQMLGYLIDEDFFNTSNEQPSTDEPIDDSAGNETSGVSLAPSTLHFEAGADSYIESVEESLVMLVDENWYEQDVWRVEGVTPTGNVNISGVSLDSIAHVAEQFSVVHRVVIGYLPVHTVHLDSCDGDEFELRFNRLTDFSALTSLFQPIINSIENKSDDFEFDARNSPVVVVQFQAAELGYRRLTYREAVFYESDLEWAIGGFHGGSEGRNAFYHLEDGGWVTKH